MKVLPQALTQLSGNVAGVALTLTGTDVKSDNGGDASKVAASYAMGNGLTLSSLCRKTSQRLQVLKTTSTLGFSYAMDALTVWLHINPGTVAGSDSYQRRVGFLS